MKSMHSILRTTLSIVIIAVAALTVSILLIFDIHQASEDEVVNRFHEHQSMGIRQLTQEIERYLRDRSRDAQVLSTFASVRNRDMKQMAAAIQGYFQYAKISHVKAISVYDEKGTIIYSKTEESIGRNYANCDFFHWATLKKNKGKYFVSSLIRATQNEIERPPYFRFVIASPVYQEARNSRSPKAGDRFAGVVTVTIDLEEVIAAFLSLLSANATKEQVWIMDTSGTVLFQSEHPEMVLKSVRRQDSTCMKCHSSFDHVETILAEKRGTIEYALRKQPKKLAAFAPLTFENVTWVVVVNVSFDEVSGFLETHLKETFLLIGIIVIALVSSSALIYRSNRLKIRAQEEAKQWQEKRELEEKIHKSEEQYRTMVETAHDMVWTLDSQGNFTYINNRSEEITGHKISDLLGKNFVPLIHPEDLAKVQEVFLQTMQGTPQSYEVRVYDIKGKIIVLSVNTVPIYQDDIVVGSVSFGRDITKRKRAEVELYRKEEHHKAVIENIFKFVPEGVLVLTESLNLLKHNKAFEDIVQKYAPLLGYSEQEFAQKIIEQLSSKVLSGDSKEIHIGKKDQLETDLSGSDEVIFHFDTARMFLAEEEEEEEEARIVVSLLDITERKQAEEELQESEKKYRDLVENALVGVYRTNLKGDILYVNEAAWRILEFDSAQEMIIGGAVVKYKNPKDRDTLIEHLRKTGKVDSFQFEALTKTGKTKTLLLSAAITGDLLTGMVLDITERKRAEEELKESEERFRSVAQSANEAIITADSTGIIVGWNRGAENIFGYTESESIGQPLSLIIPREYRDRHLIGMRRVEEGGEPHVIGSTVELHGLHKDSKVFPVELSLAQWDTSEGKFFTGIIRDITKRKQAEEELVKAKERAERSDKLKDAFIANISHEIRTPLNIILGYTSIVEDTFAASASEAEQHFFRSIHNGADRLMRTVDLILNVSRAQAGDITLTMKTIDLQQLVEKLVEDLTPNAQKKSLDLNFKNDYGHLSVNADEYCLSQALVNLLDNAIKYTNKGSVTARLYQTGSEVCLEITDTGIGISEEYLPEIFRPYSQEEIGYSRAYEGIGLGLTLVHQYLALHDVPISVTSKKGLGTTFTLHLTNIVLPAYLPTFTETVPIVGKQSMPIRTSGESSSMNKPTVLVVEDDDQTQVYMNVILSNHFEVIAADSVESAWEKIQSRPIDLILMDISIQGPKTGLALTREIRADEKYSDIPIIVVTAHAFPSDEQRSLEAGCNGYIAKPMSQTKLFQMIGEVMKRE